MPHRRAINIGQMPHHYINKSRSVQIAPTRGQNSDQNPQGGDAIDDQIPHICPPPLWGLTLIGALKLKSQRSTGSRRFSPSTSVSSHMEC